MNNARPVLGTVVLSLLVSFAVAQVPTAKPADGPTDAATSGKSPEAAASSATVLSGGQAATPTKAASSRVDLSLIPDVVKAAREAALAVQAGTARRYSALGVDACLEQGIVHAYTELNEEEKKKIFGGVAKDVTKVVASSVLSTIGGSLGGVLKHAPEAVDGVYQFRSDTGVVLNAQRAADACIGELIAVGAAPLDVFANRSEAPTRTDVALDSATTTVKLNPFVGLFVGGKEKNAPPPALAPQIDPTKVTTERILAVGKKLEASR